MTAKNKQCSTAATAFNSSALTSVPNVDVRVSLLTFAEDSVQILVNRSGDGAALPRTFPVRDESLDQTARQIARDMLGFQEQYMEQLYSFSDAVTDEWGITISYLALICSEDTPASTDQGVWASARNPGPMSELDKMVIDYALFRLRAKLGYTTIAFHLMPETFTLSELQATFEAILGRTLDKRNFRRRMATLGILANTGHTRREGSHRPARLYRYRPERDPTDYLTPPWATSEPAE